MSWICKKCSHSNLDEDEICLVCDTPRVEEDDSYGDVNHAEEVVNINKSESLFDGSGSYASDTRRDSFLSERDHRRTRRVRGRGSGKRVLNILLPILIILGSFAVGQIREYKSFVGDGYVYLLTEFLEVIVDYEIDVRPFLITTTIIGVASVICYIYLVSYFYAKRKYTNNWLITFAFAAIMGVIPATGSVVALILAILLLKTKAESRSKALAWLFVVIALASLIILPYLAGTLSPI